MYFPYLRGRQYELIALRELFSERAWLKEYITPIIEPVKVSPTLLSTLKMFNDQQQRYIIIRNPHVGSFVADSSKDKNATTFEKIIEEVDKGFAFSGVIVDKNCINSVNQLCHKGVNKIAMTAFCFNSDDIDGYLNAFTDTLPSYTFIPYSPAFRRVRKGRNCVMIGDRFKKQARNNDYQNNEDEFFSDDHLYYTDENYVGFSDYSIVGDEYSESGFAPYAVAIHIVYLANDNTLRVRHFVSDSNDDISDPANKFYEALEKLVKWNKTQKLNTLAMNAFEEMYKNESYSGLGIVKKLSIMHHMEVIGEYLREVQK